MNIIVDDLTSNEIAQLLQQHLDDMALHSPEESRHALDINALKKPGITFWSAWDNNQLLGCGALKALNEYHGEIKSMRTSTPHKRKGVAAAILTHIIEQAKAGGYQQLSLETGSMDAFKPAHALYEKFGFTECPPFPPYKLDPYSRFFTRML